MTPADLEALRLAAEISGHLNGGNWQSVTAAAARYPNEADPWLGQEIETLSRLAAGVVKGSISSAIQPDLQVTVPATNTTGAMTGPREWEAAFAAVNAKLGSGTPLAEELLAGASYPFGIDPAYSIDEGLRKSRRRKGILTSALLIVGLVAGVTVVATAASRSSGSSTIDSAAPQAETFEQTLPATAPPPTEQPSTTTPATFPPAVTTGQTAATLEPTTPPTDAPPFSADVEQYFAALTEFSTPGTERMKGSSEYLSPAWSYAHHLAKSLDASPQLEGTRTSVRTIAPGILEFCLPSRCWTISNITEDYIGRLSDFDLDGRPMRELVAAWDGDGNGMCWLVVAGADCQSDEAGLISIASIYSLTSTYVSLDVVTGSGLAADLTYVSARLLATDGREFTSTAFSGAPVPPSETGTWGLRFDAVLPADVALVSVTVRWEGGENNWDIEID